MLEYDMFAFFSKHVFFTDFEYLTVSMVSLKTITSLSIYNKIKNGKYALTKCSDKKRESESYIIYVYTQWR